MLVTLKNEIRKKKHLKMILNYTLCPWAIIKFITLLKYSKKKKISNDKTSLLH